MACVGHKGPALDFIKLLRMVHNLKLMKCLFLEYSTFQPWPTACTANAESETREGGGLLCTELGCTADTGMR